LASIAVLLVFKPVESTKEVITPFVVKKSSEELESLVAEPVSR